MTENLSFPSGSHGYHAVDPNNFAPLVQGALGHYKATIAAIKLNPVATWENSIQPLEEAAEGLDRIWSLLSHLNAVVNAPAIRKIYEDLLPHITDFHTTVMQDADLYNVYSSVRNSAEFAKLNVAQQTVITNELRDFKLSGVDLAAAQRETYKNIVQRLSELENNYANNILDATEGWSFHVLPDQPEILAGLPPYTIENAQAKAVAAQKEGWLLTLDHACYYAVLCYSQHRIIRQQMYTAYNTRASDQGPMAGMWDNSALITEILQLRQAIAQLLGYSSYAEYSLVPKMAHSVAQVAQFLQDLVVKARPKAQQELASLTAFAKQVDNIETLYVWDIAYYSELLKQKLFNISEEALRVYFPEPRVLTGLFKLVRQLYGIEIEEVTDFETWHAAVRMFKVIDQDNNLRGYFYIDLYEREGKRDGAWVAECLSRIRFASGNLQMPIAYIICNFLAPTNQGPGLLTHNDVITLFHEFGHALHNVLTQIDYYSVSGSNGVAWDAIELPSQFMENWCWQWPVIQDISEHITTGEPLPREVYVQLLATKNFQSAMALIRQLEYTIFDLRIHRNAEPDQNSSAQQILDAVRQEVGIIAMPEFNRFQNSFGHIFAGGYAAGYYSYLWAEVLSCDAFAKFTAAGLFNAEVGKAFLRNILEQGGSKPAMELFVAFAGREPMVDALLEHHAIT